MATSPAASEMIVLIEVENFCHLLSSSSFCSNSIVFSHFLFNPSERSVTIYHFPYFIVPLSEKKLFD